MELRFCLIGSLLSAGLLLGTAEAVQAQLTGVDVEGFRQIEQPIETKAAITIAGLGLIGFELWWFLFSKSKAESEQATGPVQLDAAGSTVASFDSAMSLSLAGKIATGLSSVYDGIQMPQGVLSIEDKMCPQFSGAFSPA
ncbi:MAG: hypothetical protein ACFB16_22380 [Phormidesmis sp.]